MSIGSIQTKFGLHQLPSSRGVYIYYHQNYRTIHCSFQPPEAFSFIGFMENILHHLEIFQNIWNSENNEVQCWLISTGPGFLPSTVWYCFFNTTLSSSMWHVQRCWCLGTYCSNQSYGQQSKLNQNIRKYVKHEKNIDLDLWSQNILGKLL